jgi:sugar-specific transcriptional regulator TrmB
MQDEDAIEGLKRLGLTTYEARVFLALQKLGSGAASEISDLADVPRSQVYGAADGLEERGLVEVQQSKPTVYRPVPLERAREKLLDQLAETGSETFDYLGTVQNTEEQDERTESIWMISGRESINSRAATLAERADERLLYATDYPELVSDELLTAFEAAADRGVMVVLASVDPAVLEAASDEDWLFTFEVPEDRDMDVSTARLLLADNSTILLSAMSPDGDVNGEEEVAFWASENTFASVLGELAEAFLEEPFE